MKQVAYYKGCLASLSAKELDSSTQALAPKVGYELIELESVTCCGAGDIHEAEPDYYLHLNARILAYAAATGADTLMTVCNVCTLNLRQANYQLLNDAALRERVNDNLEKVGAPRYETDVDCVHFLWLVAGESFGKLQEVAHKGLRGLKIAPFYGCQILRPSKLMGFEDPDRPDSLERIIAACGGEAIDYPAKVKCCGFPIIQAREDTALAELIQPIEQAKEAGADAIVTPCPLCHLSLDAWQSKLKKQTGKDFQMPILHLSQLIGVAAGLEDSELRFKRHVVSMQPVLEKLAHLEAPPRARLQPRSASVPGGASQAWVTRARRRSASSQSASATSDQPTSSRPSFATIWYSATASPRFLSNQMSKWSSPETRNEPASTTATTDRVARVRPADSTPTATRRMAVAATSPITSRPTCEDRCAPSCSTSATVKAPRATARQTGATRRRPGRCQAIAAAAAVPHASANVETRSGTPFERSRSKRLWKSRSPSTTTRCTIDWSTAMPTIPTAHAAYARLSRPPLCPSPTSTA